MKNLYTQSLVSFKLYTIISKRSFSNLALMFTLFLSCTIFAQTTIINPATDGAFEGASFAADGWTALNNASAGASWVQSTGATAGFTGSKCAYITGDLTASPPPHTYTVSAARVGALYRNVTIPAGETTIALSFKWICVGESGIDRLQVWAVPTTYTPVVTAVGTVASGTAPTGNVRLGLVGYNSSASWTTATIAIPAAYAGTTFRLLFQWRNDFSNVFNPPIAIDDVSLTSTCTGMIATAATGVTSTSATANWNTFAGATSYDLRYRSFVAGAYTSWTTLSNLTGTSVNLTSLDPSFYYEYEVKANGPVCNTFSTFISFSTPCANELAPTVAQNFSNFTTTAPNPICWSEAKGAVAASSVLTGTTSNWLGGNFANSGSNTGAKTSLNSISTGEWLISQPIDLGITSGIYRLKYDMALTSVGGTTTQTTLGTHFVRILISTDGGSTWSNTNTLKTYTGVGSYSNTGQIELVNLGSYTGVVKFAFVASTSSATPAVDFFIDNFIIETIPVAPPNCATGLFPSDVAVGFARNGILSWNAATGSPSSYDVYFGTSINPPLVANQIGLSYTPPTMNGSATYYWKVEPRNSFGAASCTIRSFTTGNTYNYCAVSTVNSGDYTSAFSTSLASNNITYTASSQPIGSYSSQTAQNFQVQQGTAFNFSHSYVGGGNGVKIWIDYDNNGIFENAEEVYYLADADATKTGSITVPLLTPQGIYRMRLRSVFGPSAVPTACGSATHGSTIDFSLEVIAAPSCFTSSGLSASTITTNSATLSWNASVSLPSDGYSYYYSTSNTTPDTMTTPSGTVGAGVTSVNIASLSANTVYYFWVFANCGSGNTSAWSAPSTFRTRCLGVTSLAENFDAMSAGIVFPGCWTRVVSGTASLTLSTIVPASGTLNMFMSSTAIANKSMAILPEFSNVNAGTHWLKFKVKSSTANGSLKFGYVDGVESIANFVELQTISIPNTTYTNSDQAFFIPISVPSTARLAIFNNGSTTFSYYIDDVVWEIIPPCSGPTSPAVGVLSTSNANLSWTASVSAPSSGYQWEVRTSGAAGSGVSGLVNSGSVAAGIVSAVVSGLTIDTNYSFYVRANCGTGNFSAWTSAVTLTITCPTGIWTGTTSDWNLASNWSDNRIPGECTDVTINVSNPVIINGDVKAGSINMGVSASVTVNGVLTVGSISVATGGQMTVSSGASVLQTTTTSNSGQVTVKRNSTPLYRLDYSLWSSPVSGQNLRAFSTQTLFNRFSSYETSTNTYFQEIVTTADMNTKTFTNAKGYLIRMPNNWVEYTGTAAAYQGSFTGTLNNGTVSIPLSGASTGMNLVGNPYPSPISIASFLAANSNITSTMYFWRKKASGTPGNITSGYATLNTMGFVSADVDINNVSPIKIQTGQGFFVVANSASPGNLVFNNTMRTTGPATFFRTSNETNTELHRIWLNLTSGTNVVGQTLVGYATGATQGVDNDFDAPYFNDSPLALTSIIDNAEYIIQGRALAFTDTDVVPLGFKTDVAGSYTIALSNFDGLFSGNQDIFLRDITTNTLHNLKTAAYTFTSAVGVFNTRFELRYQGTLGTDNPSLASSSILIAVKDQQIKINAGSVTMDKVELIDVAGRVIYTLEGVNSTTATIENLVSSNQMLIVRISTKENGMVSQKIIF